MVHLWPPPRFVTRRGGGRVSSPANSMGWGTYDAPLAGTRTARRDPAGDDGGIVHSRRGAPTMSRALRLWVIVLAGAGVAPAGAQGRAASVTVEPERAPRTLVLSDQARRVLVLPFRAFPTDVMGCMIGTVAGPKVFLERPAPARAHPSHP